MTRTRTSRPAVGCQPTERIFSWEKIPLGSSSLGNLAGLLESLPLLLVGIDREGKICLWSNGRQQAVHYPPQRALGRPVEVILKRLARHYRSPGLEGLATLILSAHREGTAASGWQFQFSADKRPRYLQADFTPLPVEASSKGREGVLVVQDVTERQRLEKSSSEIAHLATVGQLAACVVHEVRNPLSAVKSAAQLLAEAHSGDGMVSRYAEIIAREATRLDRLVGDFLLYARPPFLQSLPVSVGDLLERCSELLRKEAAAREVTLRWEQKHPLPVLMADSEALLQVLLNLVKNSLEASSPGGKVRITAKCEASGNGGLEIIVRDNGRGIPRKNLERVFAPFFSTKPSGTGLGLAIAKKIVEAHGGSLRLVSRPGQGTRVSILLPIARK